MQKFTNIKAPIQVGEDYLKNIIEKKLNGKIKYFKILKKSLDSRDKSNIFYVYSVEADTKEQIINKTSVNLIDKDLQNIFCGSKFINKKEKIGIVGSGPSGLFCALNLCYNGFKPIIFERGSTVDERTNVTNNFFKNHILDENCNIQFGEGGAGTFSDGKLNTQTNSPLNTIILEEFVKYGAPEEILYLSKPHIGSDILKKVIVNIRKKIIEMGGTFYFNSLVNDLIIDENKIKAVKYINNGITKELALDDLVLAIGHSSRDTFKLLKAKNIAMEQKNFAVGYRIEHLQSEIDKSQYGEKNLVYRQKNFIPPADYKLVSHANERSVFTFCMCPGGYVMPATSEKNTIVTNGMSNYKRDNINANSAIICEVKKEDFNSSNVLAGVEFQEKLEKEAFYLAGANYKAPCQLFGDFLENRKSVKFESVVPSYLGGVAFANLNELLPFYLNNPIKEAIIDMNKRLKGFSSLDAVLTGVESRTSSPIRIIRDEKFESISVKNLYPCGEGAGYAGGITSAGSDGLKISNAIVKKYYL